MKQKDRKKNYQRGMRDGIPIGLGYFAVSSAFGIQAAIIGITPLAATVMSFTNMTSAGQYASLDLIAKRGGLIALAILQLVINLRYMLMSASISQHIDLALPTRHRMGLAHCMTDEVFAVSAMQKIPLSPYYSYGVMTVAVIGWCAGTLMGASLGEVLPGRAVSALGVAIYGMFLAIIVPETTEKISVRFSVIAAMTASALLYYLPAASRIPSHYRLIIVTVAVSLLAAVIFPIDEEEEEAGKCEDENAKDASENMLPGEKEAGVQESVTKGGEE